ncbi:MAG TPA: agmatinase [Candidatus Polarisedimenticolia bacterium]|nr:agmatinase [Candidatus Polarisedimenticolia bacterium]
MLSHRGPEPPRSRSGNDCTPRARLGIAALCALALVVPGWSQESDPVHPLGYAYGDFGGLLTFLRAPYVRDLKALDADIAVLGVPFDEGTSSRPGARYGPRQIREASISYSWHRPSGGFYYIDGGRVTLKGKRWADCGDVEVVPTQPARTFENVTEAVRAIVAKKAFPVILGGDHSITFPVIRGLEASPLTLIHLDAHLDTWDSGPDDLGHAGWVLRVAKLPYVKNIVQIGMRGLANDRSAVENARRLGTTVITTEELRRDGLKAAIARIPRSERIYLSLDIDVVDPSLAPGTGTPEVGGLTFEEIDSLLQAIPSRGRLIGMDLVEVEPYHDPGEVTPLTAARLIVDLLGAALKP